MNNQALKTVFAVGATLALSAVAQSQGVEQRPGFTGEIGKPVQLGTLSPFQLILNEVEYSVEPFEALGTGRLKFDQKVLLLRFSLQNATNKPQRLRYSSIQVFAIDPQDRTFEWTRFLGRMGQSRSIDGGQIDMTLQPAQKIDLVGGVFVPAEGVIPKLMFVRSSDANAKVVRYDLREKVKPLKAPFADPEDPSGATALMEVPAEKETFYPLGRWHMRYDKIETLSAQESNTSSPRRGDSHYAVTITLKNPLDSHAQLSNGSMIGASFLVSAQGEKLKASHQLSAFRAASYSRDRVTTGETTTLRIVFRVPEGFEPAKLILAENGTNHSRGYVFDLKS